MPPADALGDDRPSDNEDALDDTSPQFNADAADDSDDESLLSEVDEAQFADFDPKAVEIAPDFETLNKSIKVSKRKRVEGEEPRPKKKKEGTREKPKRSRKQRADSDEGFEYGAEVDGKRRKTKDSGERKERTTSRKYADDVDEAQLSDETRRRRALDKAMDAAIKKPTNRKRRKDGEIDLEAAADAEIDEMRRRMTSAAQADATAREEGRPATHKLKMLPEVVALLNRNTYVSTLIDPETNLLEAVRFFLEPNVDGSLPAYNIQRDLFACLSKLPMNKETLIASGIGKVILFYTKSKRPEIGIKRQAEKLLAEWSRPILQRSDDYSKKYYESASYTSKGLASLSRGAGGLSSSQSQGAPIPKKIGVGVAPGQKISNRARVPQGVTSYTIVPQSKFVPGQRQ